MLDPPAFLSPLISSYVHPTPPHRPHVTLSFAQSLDAKIAAKHSKQLPLSGPHSLLMTHWLRSLHDAILVGIGTAINDDPQLNVRLLPKIFPPPASQPASPFLDPHTHICGHPIPLPVILDVHLRLSPTCRLLSNFANNTGRSPLVVTRSNYIDPTWQARKIALEHAGAHILTLDDPGPGLLSVPRVLNALRGIGIRSIMVEGGAHVINSFLSATPNPEVVHDVCYDPRNSPPPLVDSLIVTISPTLVGPEGVGYASSPECLESFRHVSTNVLGRDTVMYMVANREKIIL